MNREHQRLIERLESSAEDFVLYLNQLPAEELQRVPAPNEWTLHRVAAHVRDVEQQVFFYRLKRMLTEDNPAVENFDQEAWTREHYSASEPVKKIAAEMRAARKKQIALLRKAKDKDWARTAQHSTWKKISVEWMMAHAITHAMEHAAQLGNAYDKEILKNLNK
jgi:hypothetical protein